MPSKLVAVHKLGACFRPALGGADGDEHPVSHRLVGTTLGLLGFIGAGGFCALTQAPFQREQEERNGGKSKDMAAIGLWGPCRHCRRTPCTDRANARYRESRDWPRTSPDNIPAPDESGESRANLVPRHRSLPIRGRRSRSKTISRFPRNCAKQRSRGGDGAQWLPGKFRGQGGKISFGASSLA